MIPSGEEISTNSKELAKKIHLFMIDEVNKVTDDQAAMFSYYNVVLSIISGIVLRQSQIICGDSTESNKFIKDRFFQAVEEMLRSFKNFPIEDLIRESK